MKRLFNTGEIIAIKQDEVVLIRSLASNTSMLLSGNSANATGVEAYIIHSCDMEQILKACWQENITTEFKHVVLNASREAFFVSDFTPEDTAVCVTEEMRADKRKELVLRSVLIKVRGLNKNEPSLGL